MERPVAAAAAAAASCEGAGGPGPGPAAGWRSSRVVAGASASSRQPSMETLDSPTGSHVEWCKQLIAATISSQISGSVTSENVSRDYKVFRRPDTRNIHKARQRLVICMHLTPSVRHEKKEPIFY